MDLHLSISNGFVFSKIYDKHDDFDFYIVIFPFWMAMFHVVPLMECIFLNFAIVCSPVEDLNARNKCNEKQ